MKIDYKTFKYSVILLIVLVIPFNVIHEVGHLIPCYANGGQGSMSIGLIASKATCSILKDSLVFAFAGGFLAMLCGIIPAMVRKIQRSWIVIPLLSLGIGHFIVAILETFAREWYMSDIAVVVMSLMSFLIFAIMLILFGREETIRKQKWLTSKEAAKEFNKELD